MHFLDELNCEQYTAVTTTEGPVLVLAGAGSGKTRVVTYRILYLLEIGVPASQILAVTFTNKAAQEMRARVHARSKNDVLICTFHSLGLRILRSCLHLLPPYNNSFTIYDDEDTRDVIKTCFKEMHLGQESIEDTKIHIKMARQYISQIKNLQASTFNVGPPEPILEEVFQRYQAKLHQYNAVDFDDLIYLPVKILQTFPSIKHIYQKTWSHFLCDEYQDTNQAQYLMLKLLSDKKQNLCVVGDPDQSIYAWRGADINNIMNFQKEYPAAVSITLEQNYRSRSNILQAANALIAHNNLRYEKNLWSNRGEGEQIAFYRAQSEKDEADFVAKKLSEHHKQNIPWDQMVIFYRTHAQSRAFEDVFLSMRIPYLIIGGISFYQRREIKDILALLRVVHSDIDFLAFRRSINTPKRGLGEGSLGKLYQAAESAHVGIFAYCKSLVSDPAFKAPFRLARQQSLKEYVHMIQELRTCVLTDALSVLIQKTIDKSGYVEHLKKDPLTYQERLENLGALIAKAAEWEHSALNPNLESFLEELALRSQLEETDEVNSQVHLMTVHNGKGLEYEIAFLVGLEKGFFPHVNSMETLQEIEEERRLFYVGMTRAKEQLYLSCARKRNFWGSQRQQEPSLFLDEIPEQYIKRAFSAAPARITTSYVSNAESVKVAYPPENLLPSFEVGDLVCHDAFGEGLILRIYTGGGGLTFTVLFTETKTERTVVARYAHLKKLA